MAAKHCCNIDPSIKGDHDISAFEFDKSLYADDGSFLFPYRKELELGTNILVKHFTKFGMKMHIGTGEKKSKTEFTLFPNSKGAMGQSRNPISIINDAGGEIGQVTHAESFVYLGSTIPEDLDDMLSVKARICKAQAVFNALRKPVFNSKDFSLTLKGRLYNILVLSVLMYGAESWCTLSPHVQALSVFHHRCARDMCRVSIFAKQRTTKLLKKLKLSSMQSILSSRFLHWLGHVARLPETAPPRMMLTSFITHEQNKITKDGHSVFSKPSTMNNSLLKKNARFQKRTYGSNAFKWLERAAEHPEFKDTVFDINPETNTSLKENISEGLSCKSPQDFDFQHSWLTLAQNRETWTEVCLLADHELKGKARVERRQKIASKAKAKNSRLINDAAIWHLY